MVISNRHLDLDEENIDEEEENRIYVSMDNGGFYISFSRGAEKKLREFLEKNKEEENDKV